MTSDQIERPVRNPMDDFEGYVGLAVERENTPVIIRKKPSRLKISRRTQLINLTDEAPVAPWELPPLYQLTLQGTFVAWRIGSDTVDLPTARQQWIDQLLHGGYMRACSQDPGLIKIKQYAKWKSQTDTTSPKSYKTAHYPVFALPYLGGTRRIASWIDHQTILKTPSNNIPEAGEFPLHDPALQQFLAYLPNGCHLDGYILPDKRQYYLVDILGLEDPYPDRWHLLRRIADLVGDSPRLILLPATQIDSDEQVENCQPCLLKEIQRNCTLVCL